MNDEHSQNETGTVYVTKVLDKVQRANPTILKVELSNGEKGEALYAPALNPFDRPFADVRKAIGIPEGEKGDQKFLRAWLDLDLMYLQKINEAISNDPHHLPFVDAKKPAA